MSLSSLQLDAFAETVRQQGFSRAAKKLRISQSALSQRILNLEEELGTSVLIRDAGGIRLTEAGEALLKYCRQREELETEVLSRLKPASGRPREESRLGGSLRIAGYSTVLRSIAMPALDSLMRANPAVQLTLMSRELRDLPSMLRSAEADFLLLDEELDRPGIRRRPLGHEEYVLVESARNPIAGRREVYLDHDADDRITELFLQAQRKPSPETRTYLNDIYAILDATAMGWGRAVVPRHLLNEREDLREIPNLKPLRVPVVLHSLELPYASQLHAAALVALEEAVPRLLSGHGK